ncbi:MAG: hypothetical protein JST10_04865 [Bacteroidetes bacterium]|nr:hypothetical protein [Bacteroidota bacterium]MBS1631885.1 hypothetical protein [Bacteroidota bacterium]
MEVHHHPHVEKKNFKDYFLEFLMIFLAVTLGFIAENIREHYHEKNIAEELLKGYKAELINQQSIFANVEKEFAEKLTYCDSAKQIIYNGEENRKLNTLENLFYHISGLNIPSTNTSAYDQIVSSGSLRYITNTNLLNLMGQYRAEIEKNKNYNASITQAVLNMEPEISKIQDLHNLLHEDSIKAPDGSGYIFPIKPFGSMTSEQRGVMVWYYELFYVQTYSNLQATRKMKQSNQELTDLVEKELDKY